MLVKRTSKNQFTLPKAFLKTAGIVDTDSYFDAEYDGRRHAIFLKPVRVVIEEKIPEKTIEQFEAKALRLERGDRAFHSRKEADQFLESRLKKR